MSKKIIGIGLTIVGVALMAIPGVGTALGLGALTIAGATISTATIIGLGLEVAGSLLVGPSIPKGLSTGPMTTQRLTATLVTTDPRKIWFGHTAGATDMRYQVFTGANQEYLEMIVCCASHAVHSIDELWLDNEKAWINGSGAQGRFAGYLTVTPIVEGTSSNGIAINSTWTAQATLTGCAYVHIKAKLTGNSDKVSSPFASGVTSRMTIRGKGAKVYDPRLDSTVAGGSGAQRADDQTTWTWDDNASRNPALQELFYELGWRINGKLAVGKGVPSARLDLASYAVGANICDESITLNGGGTEPRYRSDGIVSEGDDTSAVRENLCSTMNAMLRDSGGKLALSVIHNDLATPITPSGKSAFDENDVLGDIQWDQTPDLSQMFNIVRGRMIDASDSGLYQPVDFPDVPLASTDGIDRIEAIDYPFVQSGGQAQRLAKQHLQRGQYQGTLTLTGMPSFWGLNVGDVFPFTHSTFGWSAKLFRLASQKISRTGQTEIVAIEENSAIYQWDNNEKAVVVAGAPVVYDPLNAPLIGGIQDASNSSAPGDANRVRFSQFERGLIGWSVGDEVGAANPSFTIMALNGGGGILGNYLRGGGAFTANDQVFGAGTYTGGLTNGVNSFTIPVEAGERIFASAVIWVGSAFPAVGTWEVTLGFLDVNGAETGSRIVIGQGTGVVTISTRYGAFGIVPAAAVSAFFRFDLFNHSGGAASNIDFYFGFPMVCSAGSSQTLWPAFTPGPGNLPSDNSTAYSVDLLSSYSFAYNYDGTKNYTTQNVIAHLKDQAGANISSGITWKYAVISGAVNGNAGDGGTVEYAMTVDAGQPDSPYIPVTSLGNNSNIVEIRAYLGSIMWPKRTELDKDIAAAPPPSGGSGAGSLSVNGSVSGSAFSSTPVAIGTISGTTPSGVTAVTLTANLTVDIQSTSGSVIGTAQWQQLVGSTWTNVGASGTATSSYSKINGETQGSISMSTSVTGLTQNTAYQFRVVISASNSNGVAMGGPVTLRG